MLPAKWMIDHQIHLLFIVSLTSNVSSQQWNNCLKIWLFRFPTYRDTIVMVKLAGDELFWVVVLVRWEQLTQDSSRVDIEECSQVKGEAWRYVDTRKTTLASFCDKVWTNAGDVEVGKLVGLKFGISHSLICTSAERFTTYINNFHCRNAEQRKDKTRLENGNE